jgi:hypothetical protein
MVYILNKRSRLLGATAAPGFIDPYQKVPTNAKTQRSYPDFFCPQKWAIGES